MTLLILTHACKSATQKNPANFGTMVRAGVVYVLPRERDLNMLLNIRMAQKSVNSFSRKVRNKSKSVKTIRFRDKMSVTIYLDNTSSNFHSQNFQNTMHSMVALRTQPGSLRMTLQDTIPR